MAWWDDVKPLGAINGPATVDQPAGAVGGIYGPATGGAPAVRLDSMGAPIYEQQQGPTGTPAPPGPPPGAPASANPATQTTAPGALLAELRAYFPWLDQVGFSPEFFQSLVAEAASPDEIVQKLRQTSQFKQRFAGLWRKDGSLRMTEAQYLQQENAYRSVLRQYGYGDAYSDAVDLVGFFESEQDPNELKERLDTYKRVKDSSQATKDAFYVYAGLKVTDDDLYAAVVDPAAKQRLTDEYNSKVAASQFNYEQWITRATEVGLSRVASTLKESQKAGAVTATAVQRVLQVDPNFARQIMDVLYTGGQAPGPNTQYLNLSELLASFEQAAIGATATQAGLTLPSKERIAAFRAAGIDRARAQSVYTQFSQNANIYDDAVRRTGGGGFDQTDVEDAVFMGDASKQSRLAAGLAREEAAGQRSGQFGMDQDRSGQFVQRGFRRV